VATGRGNNFHTFAVPNDNHFVRDRADLMVDPLRGLKIRVLGKINQLLLAYFNVPREL
jgi:hypothetical protein